MANMNTFTYTDSMMSRFEFRNVGNTFPLERCAANTTSWILLAASPGQKKQSQSHCSLGIFLLTLFPDFLDRLGKTWKHVLKHGHIICIYFVPSFPASNPYQHAKSDENRKDQLAPALSLPIREKMVASTSARQVRSRKHRQGFNKILKTIIWHVTKWYQVILSDTVGLAPQLHHKHLYP